MCRCVLGDLIKCVNFSFAMEKMEQKWNKNYLSVLENPGFYL